LRVRQRKRKGEPDPFHVEYKLLIIADRDYVEALQEEMNVWAKKTDLEERVAVAEAANVELKEAADKHKRLQAELEALYQSIFDGPNPGMQHSSS
jgi:hypothetical protein